MQRGLLLRGLLLRGLLLPRLARRGLSRPRRGERRLPRMGGQARRLARAVVRAQALGRARRVRARAPGREAARSAARAARARRRSARARTQRALKLETACAVLEASAEDKSSRGATYHVASKRQRSRADNRWLRARRRRSRAGRERVCRCWVPPLSRLPASLLGRELGSRCPRTGDDGGTTRRRRAEPTDRSSGSRIDVERCRLVCVPDSRVSHRCQRTGNIAVSSTARDEARDRSDHHERRSGFFQGNGSPRSHPDR